MELVCIQHTLAHTHRALGCSRGCLDHRRWAGTSPATSAHYQCHCVCVFQDGQFSVLQTESAAGWCVNPQNGEQIRMATLSPGGHFTCINAHTCAHLKMSSTSSLCPHSDFLPPSFCLPLPLSNSMCSGPTRCQLLGFQCQPDGSFLPLQCDMTSCWCVSEDGQEVRGTRTRRHMGQVPSCDCKCVTSIRTDLTVTMLNCSFLPQLLFVPPLPLPMVHWCASQQPIAISVVN